jgi:hypothetical protein
MRAVSRVQILECGDKSRAVRGSRHRFPSALRAEPLLVPTLSRIHLVSTPSRLRQRRSFGTKCVGRSVGTKCRDVRLAVPLLHTPCRCTLAQKAASRGIPLAAALQVLSPGLRSRRHTVKTSASLRLCVKNFSPLNFLRARTPALPTAHSTKQALGSHAPCH